MFSVLRKQYLPDCNKTPITTIKIKMGPTSPVNAPVSTPSISLGLLRTAYAFLGPVGPSDEAHGYFRISPIGNVQQSSNIWACIRVCNFRLYSSIKSKKWVPTFRISLFGSTSNTSRNISRSLCNSMTGS